MTDPQAIAPDTKDWTWVLTRPCPQCGYDAAHVEPSEVGARTRSAQGRWQLVLGRPDVRQRPAPEVWSPLEYACHVRDVMRIFDQRLALMLSEDDARFANWDQDSTALEGRYAEQSPAAVGPELAAAADRIATRFDGVQGEQWQRGARRSDGATFTTASFARYYLHDVEHHLHDVAG